MRMAGAGYRVVGSLPVVTSRKWKRLAVILRRPDPGAPPLDYEFWLGRDAPQHPYIKGRLVAFLRHRLRPKELMLPPDQMVTDEEVEVLERTVLRSWMEQYLETLRFYHGVIWAPDPPLVKILESPVVERSWKIHRKQNQTLFRYGLSWTLYDMVGSLSQDPRVMRNILSDSLGDSGGGPCGLDTGQGDYAL